MISCYYNAYKIVYYCDEEVYIPIKLGLLNKNAAITKLLEDYFIGYDINAKQVVFKYEQYEQYDQCESSKSSEISELTELENNVDNSTVNSVENEDTIQDNTIKTIVYFREYYSSIRIIDKNDISKESQVLKKAFQKYDMTHNTNQLLEKTINNFSFDYYNNYFFLFDVPMIISPKDVPDYETIVFKTYNKYE